MSKPSTSSKWKQVKLADYARIVSGATPKTSDPRYWNGDIYWVTPKDISDLAGYPYLDSTPRTLTAEGLASCSAEMLPPGSVLLSSRAPIGLVAVNRIPVATNQGFKSFVPDSASLNAGFLYHWLRANRAFLEDLGRGATFKEISKAVVSRIEIPLPPVDEQKRIAAVLDKADLLRRQRRESVQLADDLVQAIFVEMFVRNPAVEDWKSRPIEWMAKEGKGTIRTGPFGSQLLHSEFVDAGIAVLGIDNAVKNRFEWGRPRFISPAKYQDLKRYKVFPGDLIITIMGTLGRCAIVPDDIPEAINTKHLCCITLDHKKCIPEFLHACLLHHPTVLRQLGVRTKGAVMPGLNMGIIKELELPLPPIELQEQFKRVIAASTPVRLDSEKSRKVMDDLFGALQQRAFRGELELSRIVLDYSTDLAPALEPEKPASKGTKPDSAALFLQAPEAVKAVLNDLDGTVSKGEQIPWSADYFKYRILGVQPVPFSFGEVMQKADSVFDEPSYEEIKDMILDMLGKGGRSRHPESKLRPAY